MSSQLEKTKTVLARLLRSRTLGMAVGFVALVLLALAILGLNDRMPSLPPVRTASDANKKDLPVAKIEMLLAKDTFGKTRLALNGTHAFFTRFFEPPPRPKPSPSQPEQTPAPPPKPPPPTTRKAALLYQGVYETASGGKKAFIVVENNLQVLTPGSKVIADWTVADIALRALTLTNAASQTNILSFNIVKELEVPIAAK